MCTSTEREEEEKDWDKKNKYLFVQGPVECLSTAASGMHAGYTAFEGLCICACVHGCIARARYQQVQVHALESVTSHISEHPRASKVRRWLSVRLSLSLLIKREEKQQAEGAQDEERGWGTTQREDNREHEREWVYVHTRVLMKERERGRTEMERKRFILWLIILIVSLRSAEERELWEPEEYTKTLAQYTCIHNGAVPQRLMKVWAAVFLKVHWIPPKFRRQD